MASGSAASTTTTSTPPGRPSAARFATQIALARELDLALVVHARDAFDDLFAILSSEGVPARTVIHCFTGTPEDAEGCLALGCDISISGIVTFKNADACARRRDSFPSIDCTWRPTARSSRRCPIADEKNEPAFVSLVGEYVAELRGEDLAGGADGDVGQLRAALPTTFGLSAKAHDFKRHSVCSCPRMRPLLA